MSGASRYTGSVGRLGFAPDTGRDQSSSGVVVELVGWRPGMRKVSLTKLLRQGGNGLAASSRITRQILEGEHVRVRLRQFASVEAARAVLTKLGVEEVRA